MRLLGKITTLIIQLIVTTVVMIIIYMIFALIDYEGGFDGFFGMALIQPIMALIVSSVTALACFIIGLPIRLSANIFAWWSNRLYIQLAMLMIGITLLILSIIPQNMDQVILSGDLNNTKLIPDKLFSLAGWFITAFSLMHIFPIKVIRLK